MIKIQNVLRVANQLCTLVNQFVATRAFFPMNTARYRQNFTIVFDCPITGIDCTAFFAGFDDSDSATESHNDSVARDESALVSFGTQRKFAHDKTVFGNSVEQLFFFTRTTRTETLTQNGNRATRFKRARVCETVNAASRTAYDSQTCRRKFSAEISCDILTVRRVVARALRVPTIPTRSTFGRIFPR